VVRVAVGDGLTGGVALGNDGEATVDCVGSGGEAAGGAVGFTSDEQAASIKVAIAAARTSFDFRWPSLLSRMVLSCHMRSSAPCQFELQPRILPNLAAMSGAG